MIRYLSGALLGLVVFAMAVVAIPSSRFANSLSGYGNESNTVLLGPFMTGGVLANGNCARTDAAADGGCFDYVTSMPFPGSSGFVEKLSCFHDVTNGENADDSIGFRVLYFDDSGTFTNDPNVVTFNITDLQTNDYTESVDVNTLTPYTDGQIGVAIAQTDSDVSITNAQFSCFILVRGL